ncbi:hypothetical protein BK120_08235 [Paenibacillus sp. FSL A5-0031]|uniref:RNA dependent RNA polymerase n=1 Tax=Paenibacillus sp. FSL A5-0031 TaxID=1920420 RepID=UPI00096C14BD|nr:hypothetical protein [Paenibacillus sp. FSL A5-0031]OME86901.1 hypothetical protein BK120_08235 [Paenibacillus sp. FSL A5-0031]
MKQRYLSKQVYVYNVDTSAFYTEEEISLQTEINALKRAKEGAADKEQVRTIRASLRESEELLRTQFDTYGNVRRLREERMTDKAVISLFESALTRTLGIEPGKVTKDLIVVETYYQSILRSLILNGFIFHNDKYVCLTASAGQIREHKTVFIRESAWIKHEGALTAGLSVEMINAKGGTNTNKYLAYLALSNSATEVWRNFRIDRAIVVNDMEFPVKSLVDYIDCESFEITRQVMPVKINHTDGCGMILPRKSRKSFMVRMPWVKGLLVPFPFDKFAQENGTRIVRDIYGKEWDIIKDEIEVIFTKSQFKMWKFYTSWQEYADNFKTYGCQAAKCAEEPEEFAQAKSNYQMLQTLTDMTDTELRQLTSRTARDIINIGNDRETMLELMGVTSANKWKGYYQQALELYPELLSDEYSRQQLKAVKKSVVTKARAGKFKVDGVFTYIIPDLYAFCEWLFLGDEHPKGLIANGQVSCSIYEDGIKLDCLRSPHLYREHAIRTNTVSDETKLWFKSRGIYTSCHDSISKLLMFDCDGDKGLVIRDQTLVSVAERHMSDIVPLHYEMKTATTELINGENMFKGLHAAYTGGNIGEVSNNISKVWNSHAFNLDAVKILCCINNFVIDYAKTLYKPDIPVGIKSIIQDYTRTKVPYFFRYAKGKEREKVAPVNRSVVNRLHTLIPNRRINFSAANLGHFNYQRLMRNKRVTLKSESAQAIITKYKELDTRKHSMSHVTIDGKDSSFMYVNIRNQLLAINGHLDYVVDVLIKYLYVERSSSYKTTLWSSFGDVIVRNLRSNIDNKLEDGFILCADCGVRTELVKQRQIRCSSCSETRTRERKRLQKQRERKFDVAVSS